MRSRLGLRLRLRLRPRGLGLRLLSSLRRGGRGAGGAVRRGRGGGGPPAGCGERGRGDGTMRAPRTASASRDGRRPRNPWLWGVRGGRKRAAGGGGERGERWARRCGAAGCWMTCTGSWLHGRRAGGPNEGHPRPCRQAQQGLTPWAPPRRQLPIPPINARPSEACGHRRPPAGAPPVDRPKQGAAAWSCCRHEEDGAAPAQAQDAG